MAIVRTVTGDVEAGQLGPTTMHEHIFGDFTVWQEDPKQTASLASVTVDPSARVEMGILGVIHRNPVVIRDNLRIGDDEALALAEVRKFADAGGDCLVEVTCCGDVAADGVTNMGRNAPGLRRIAEETGLKIVAGTGFYLEGTHPDYVRTDSVEELAARMIRDISEGIEGTGIRAGIIGEIGTSTFTEREQKVLRACARAHQATGAAISLHTHVGCPTGEQSVQLLLEEGVAANRIIVGHMDENLVSFEPGLAHIDYHRRVADLGVYVQYDTFGAEWYYNQDREPMDAERAAAVAIQITEGHLDQILLGQDVWLKNCYKHYGGLGYDHLFTGVRALLTQAGVTEDQFQQILIDNPRRALVLQTSLQALPATRDVVEPSSQTRAAPPRCQRQRGQRTSARHRRGSSFLNHNPASPRTRHTRSTSSARLESLAPADRQTSRVKPWAGLTTERDRWARCRHPGWPIRCWRSRTSCRGRRRAEQAVRCGPPISGRY